MKRNGFTLIELLAVIVILAIIALIATPIILGIINDAREEAKQRSFDLYVSAVRNAITSYQLEESDSPADFSKLDIKTEGGSVECSTKKLHSDGSFYLSGCTINGTETEYTYGVAYKPQYYFCLEGFELKKIGTESFKNHSVSREYCGYSYIGYDVDSNNITTAAYVCFIRNEAEYCLKGYDKDAYATNVDIIKHAYADVLDDSCNLETDSVGCSDDHLSVSVSLNLDVSAIFMDSIDNFCYTSRISNDGRFEYDVGDRS